MLAGHFQADATQYENFSWEKLQIALDNWKHRKWQSDGKFVQNAQLGRFQTGTGFLGTLNLALTGLFQEIQIQYLL